MPLTHGDRASWLEEIWKALEDWRDAHPESDAQWDERWDEICTAMAWIGEDLDVTGSL